MIDVDTLKRDLQKSFPQFEKSMERKGLDSYMFNSDSLYWDHEGLDAGDYPLCTHVSEGEEDEELLENLKALDPCGEFDDDTFPKRFQPFLEKYEKKVAATTNETIPVAGSLINPTEHQGKESQSPESQTLYSGVAGKNIVRFKDFPEVIASPIIGRQPPRRSLFPTPAPSVTPDARSTPLLTTEEKEISDKSESPTKISTKFKPRRLQPPEIVDETIADTPPCSSSFIDV